MFDWGPIIMNSIYCWQSLNLLSSYDHFKIRCPQYTFPLRSLSCLFLNVFGDIYSIASYTSYFPSIIHQSGFADWQQRIAIFQTLNRFYQILPLLALALYLISSFCWTSVSAHLKPVLWFHWFVVDILILSCKHIPISWYKVILLSPYLLLRPHFHLDWRQLNQSSNS